MAACSLAYCWSIILIIEKSYNKIPGLISLIQVIVKLFKASYAKVISIAILTWNSGCFLSDPAMASAASTPSVFPSILNAVIVLQLSIPSIISLAAKKFQD